jgi:HEAT repeat protein
VFAHEAPDAWSVGERLVYAVSIGATLGGGQDPAADATVLRGSAALDLSVVSVAAQELVLQAAVSEISLTARSRQMAERHVENHVREGLSRPFLIHLRPDGYVDAIQMDAQTRGMDRSLLRTIVAGLSFVGPREGAAHANEWSTDEADQNGVATVSYVKVGPRRFKKVKTGYKYLELSHHLPLGAKGGAPSIAFEGTVERGSDGVLETVDGVERLSIPFGRASFRAETQLKLELKHRGVTSADALDATGLPKTTLYDYGPEDGPSAANLEQRRRDLVAGASFATLSRELEGLPATKENWAARWNVKRRMTALLELDSTNLPAIRDKLKRSRSQDETDMLLAALSDAATPGAQASLAALASDSEATPQLRGSAVIHMGLQQHPTAETIATLSTMVEGSNLEDLKDSAALALGSAARQARDARTAGEAPREAVAGLTTAYAKATDAQQRKVYLDALGNAADAQALPIIKEALADPDPVIRGAAANAARSIPGPEADAVIATALRDPENLVRTRALMALEDRPLTPTLAEILVAALRTEASPGTRANVISILGRRLGSQPMARPALEWARDNDPVPSVREAAARALQSPLASGAKP